MKKIIFSLTAAVAILVSCGKGENVQPDGGDIRTIKVPALAEIASDVTELGVFDAEGDNMICHAPYSAETGCNLTLPATVSESIMIDVPSVSGLKIYIGTVRCMTDGEKNGQWIVYDNDDGYVSYLYSNLACELMGISLVKGWNRMLGHYDNDGAEPVPASGLDWSVKGEKDEEDDPLTIKVPALPGIETGTDELVVCWPGEPGMTVCRAPYSAAGGCTLRLPDEPDESVLKVADTKGVKVFMGVIYGFSDGEPTGQAVYEGNDDGLIVYLYITEACELVGASLEKGWNNVFMANTLGSSLPMPANTAWMVRNLSE